MLIMKAKNQAAYDHLAIEKKWQKEWEYKGIYTVPDYVEGKENYFTLVEFTYPSGNLHVGHWYAFAVPDIFARYKRMRGFNVLYSMGFDAFGLPAENAAIKLGADPKVWTYDQMNKMREQFRSIGASFDWKREIVSCDPLYYKWTQWMFNQFLKNDLVYRAKTKVNWCPKDQTILANEQVIDGKCERCGSDVVQRDQEQWMLRITKYADRLIDDLDGLSWPDPIKDAQKNWIGRSEGSDIDFTIQGSGEVVSVFTTRADTLFGVTYVVLAPEHPLVNTLLENVSNKEEALAYIASSKKKSELDRQQSKEKTGVELKGITAVNPATGEAVPVWIADYVLAAYGTGAVMAVPAHDERDFEFAKKYGLPSINVIEPTAAETALFVDSNKYSVEEIRQKSEDSHNLYLKGEFCYTNISPQSKLRNSGNFDGLHPIEAKQKITESVGGRMKKTYRLRDWGISRQRYWGCPIPIVYDPAGSPHAVPDEHLPWLLPTDVDHTPDGTSPLARSKELLERTEHIFGKGWKPEVETMDTFVDSAWYFYRYLDPRNEESFADAERRKAWMPIDLYMGGPEHTTMHLLYSRFWVKALHDLGLVAETEAYTMRRNRGLILGPDGNKMSKSKGNVVDPDSIVALLGADTVRMYLAFMGPYGITANYPWDPNGVVGLRRFLERVWRLKEKVGEGNVTPLLHKTVKKVSEDIEEYKFNTAISAMMILLNAWEKEASVLESEYKTLLCLLAPFAPHMAEELWHEFDEVESVHLESWPTYDTALLVEEIVVIGVQINGKLRAELETSTAATKEELQAAALSLPRIKEYTEGTTIKNIIVVPGRIINIVL
jgi:leucyl-tRNA synthetase